MSKALIGEEGKEIDRVAAYLWQAFKHGYLVQWDVKDFLSKAKDEEMAMYRKMAAFVINVIDEEKSSS